MNSDFYFEYNYLNENNLSEYDSYENIIEKKKYFLIKEKKFYPFEVIKRKDEILIKSKNYYIICNEKELSLLTNEKICSLDDAYKYFIKSFDEKRIKIDEIIEQETIKLILKTNKTNEINKLEITLIFYKEQKDLIIEKLIRDVYQLNTFKFDLKKELKLLKKDFNNQLEYLFNSLNFNINNNNFNIRQNQENQENQENLNQENLNQ